MSEFEENWKTSGFEEEMKKGLPITIDEFKDFSTAITDIQK